MEEHNNVRTWSEKVSNKIRKRILDGEWRVGDKIPNEQILAKEMNVSRTTIREAIKLLISSHILRIERGVGTFVVDVPDSFLESSSDSRCGTSTMLQDICEYRFLLEPIACALAAERASEEDLNKMGEIISEFEMVSTKMRVNSNHGLLIDRLAAMEVRFHTLVYKMTNNILFQQVGQTMNSTVFETYMVDHYRHSISTSQLKFVDRHIEIYEGIRNRNPEQALIAGKKHMQITYQELMGSDPPENVIYT